MATKDVVPRIRSRKGLPAIRERSPFYSLQREVNRLFDDFFGRELTFPLQESEWFNYPHLDVKETDKQVEVTAELPGLSEKDVQIWLTRDSLTIKGEKKEEKEEKEANYHRMERRYGAFNRVISLPESVDPNKVDATFKNGVLDITIQKQPEAKSEAKKVPIQALKH